MSLFDKSLRFCCSLFREAMIDPDRRGLSILPRRHPRFGDHFFLQFRAIDKENEGKFVGPPEIPIVVSTNQAISHCPWCGATLEKFYRKTFDQLPFVLEDDSEYEQAMQRQQMDTGAE